MRTDADIEHVMDANGDAVWRVCLMRMGQRASAQDVFQETFLRYALADDHEFHGEDHVRAWLIRVATNLCTDALRHDAHVTQPDPDDPAEEPLATEPSEQPDEALWEVRDALNDLPAEQRQAVYLTVCEGYPATEVARLMGAPPNTVYSWIARGKARLREVLG